MKRILACALAAVTVVSECRADSFKILGARPMGMGGAFVAVADNALAQYWNPAGLGPQTRFDLQTPLGLRAEFTGGILNNADNISNVANDFKNLQTAQTSDPTKFDAKTLSAFYKDIKEIQDLNEPGKGALFDVAAGANVRMGRIAVSVNNFTSVGASPFIDLTGLSLSGIAVGAAGAPAQSDSDLAAAATTLATVIGNSRAAFPNVTGTNAEIASALITQATANGVSKQDIINSVNSAAENEPLVRTTLGNASGSFATNQTRLDLRTGSFTEAAIGYAHRFFADDLYWGGNFKIISGRVGFFRQNILSESDQSLNLFDNSKNSVKPAVDLGFLYDKRRSWRTRFGIVGKNLNSPSFDQPTAGANAGLAAMKLESQLRGGVAVYPLNWWTIAMDIDLTKNKTLVNGFSSRMWGLGTEINVFNKPWLNIPLRAGLMKNLAESDSKISYTAGFGLNFLHLVFEVAGAVSSERVNIKSDATSTQVPTNVSIGATLSVLFGGRKDDEPRKPRAETPRTLEQVPAEAPAATP